MGNVGYGAPENPEILSRFIPTKAVVIQMVAIQIPALSCVVAILAMTIIFAAAMAYPVSFSLSVLVSFLLCLAKVVEIDDLGHAFAPSFKSGAVLTAYVLIAPKPKQLFTPYRGR